MKPYIVVAFCCSLAACGAVDNKPQTTLSSVDIDNKAEIHICRPSSFVKSFEAPDLFLNGSLVGEITNGTDQVFYAPVGAELRLVFQKNFIVQRFKDQTLYETKIKDDTSYIIVSTGDPDWMGASAAAFGVFTPQDRSLNRWWNLNTVPNMEQYENICSE